jgi:hypothetical protein
MWNKFLYYCDKNKFTISVITVILVCAIAGISTLVFNNSYYNTGWHWSVSLLGFGIMFFVNFCIKDSEDDNI